MKHKDIPSREAFVAEPQEVRRALLGALPKGRRKRTTRLVARALSDPLFPLSFLVRNVMALSEEPNWRRLSGRAQRLALSDLLQQRSACFCAVKDWLRRRRKRPEPLPQLPAGAHGAAGCSGYCTHCGGCCEIASGLPDFPAGVEIPTGWINLFGRGLGRYHRFCPFLWEIDGTGQSLCAIHEWRPNPCRLFAEDECRFLLTDPAYRALHNRPLFVAACRYLCGQVRKQWHGDRQRGRGVRPATGSSNHEAIR